MALQIDSLTAKLGQLFVFVPFGPQSYISKSIGVPSFLSGELFPNILKAITKIYITV